MTADRRASDAAPVRPAAMRTASAEPNDGLTRRERKVRNLLLRELRKLGDSRLLSYAEIHHLEKRLSVDFIDRELQKMHKQYRTSRWLWLAYVIVFGLQSILFISKGTTFAITMAIASIAMGGLGPFFMRRAVRRKIFIYEALRELAGADEAGVTLDQAVRDADELISRIVDRELAADDTLPARTIGRIRLN
ncbi:MAG: hypothetical protein HKN13_14200 [Rhodothermales bacterium]|nr:hypothetical protein [Rhodothermales bacterium]